ACAHGPKPPRAKPRRPCSWRPASGLSSLFFASSLAFWRSASTLRRSALSFSSVCSSDLTSSARWARAVAGTTSAPATSAYSSLCMSGSSVVYLGRRARLMRRRCGPVPVLPSMQERRRDAHEKCLKRLARQALAFVPAAGTLSGVTPSEWPVVSGQWPARTDGWPSWLTAGHWPLTTAPERTARDGLQADGAAPLRQGVVP